jgi:hypothetical protein
MIPDSVTNIGNGAFAFCTSLTVIYCQGSVPSMGASGLLNDPATICYLPGTAGWGSTYGGCPMVLWNPQVQTGDASFGVRTNQFEFTITGTSNLVLSVEACTNVANPIWSPVGTNTLSGGSSYFSDPQWTNYPARFYRITQPQTAAAPNGTTRLANGSMQVVFSGTSGHLYPVQASSNLATWTILASVPANSYNKVIYLDANSPSNATRYYRIEPASGGITGDDGDIEAARDAYLPFGTRVLACQAFCCFYFNQPGLLTASPYVDEALGTAIDIDPTDPITLIQVGWNTQLHFQTYRP